MTKNSTTMLKPGTLVRLLKDVASLRKGQIGTVSEITCWLGESDSLVRFLFNAGVTGFSQPPQCLPDLVEIIHAYEIWEPVDPTKAGPERTYTTPEPLTTIYARDLAECGDLAYEAFGHARNLDFLGI